MQNFIFFGDSICFGQGVSPHLTWVSRLSYLISEIAPELTVINTSINGNTTRMALERMPHDVQSHGVKFGLVQFGMNDCNYWVSDGGVPRVSKIAFAANLEEIILRMVKFGAQRVILNTSHPTTRTETWDHVGTSYEQSNAEYAEIVRAVAQKLGETVRLNDVRQSILNSNTPVEDLVLSDRLHLSLKGHDEYFRITAPIVRDLLRGRS